MLHAQGLHTTLSISTQLKQTPGPKHLPSDNQDTVIAAVLLGARYAFLGVAAKIKITRG